MNQYSERISDYFSNETATVELKIFTDKDISGAERAVNHWLKHNPVVIRHIGQSQSERGGNFIFSLSLFYSKLT